MSGLNNMKARIAFRGGNNQHDRMVADKLWSLKKALIYSYQSATVGLYNPETKACDREFRCLINPNKVNMDLDDKVISMPYEDIQLNAEKVGTTTEGLTLTGIKTGSIVYWIDTNTHWLVYYQYLQERAYFRGMMRQCEAEPLMINGEPHYYYLKGPDEQNVNWQKSKHFIFNDINYSVEMYISKTEIANEFFQRFAKIELKGKPFEVQAVDRISSDDILTVYLKEDFTNTWARDSIQDLSSKPEEAIDLLRASISGPKEVYPYDTIVYTITNATDGQWRLNNTNARIAASSATSATVEIISGKSGDVVLAYEQNGITIAELAIKILSL